MQGKCAFCHRTPSERLAGDTLDAYGHCPPCQQVMQQRNLDRLRLGAELFMPEPAFFSRPSSDKNILQMELCHICASEDHPTAFCPHRHD